MTIIPRFKVEPIRERSYLDYLKTQPCVVTGVEGTEDTPLIEPAHLRLDGAAGVGEKPQDCHVLPLHYKLHRRQNGSGECASWIRCANEYPLFIIRIFNEYPELLERMLKAYAEIKYQEWKRK